MDLDRTDAVAWGVLLVRSRVDSVQSVAVEASTSDKWPPAPRLLEEPQELGIDLVGTRPAQPVRRPFDDNVLTLRDQLVAAWSASIDRQAAVLAAVHDEHWYVDLS